jgi:hypothetical protein
VKRFAPFLALALAAPAGAAETIAVLAVADPPAGPEPELAEMAHQLRAACRDRAGGVQDVPEMRARLLGQASNATLPELERAYGAALATYQNGEYEGSIRTLYAVIEDLEKLPESQEGYAQWIRAHLRLAHAEATIGHTAEARAAMERLLSVEPKYQPDPEQYSPTYRRELDQARLRVAALSRRTLTVTSAGRPGTVFVNGRTSGITPVTLSLPIGRYRVGGAAGPLRVPSFLVDLTQEDRSALLDFTLAEALRVNAGPGLALARPSRAGGIVRAGAWLGVDRVVAASVITEGEAQFLAGSIYDVRRGALTREGRVRMAAGAVPSPNIGALAAFLLTGQPSRVIVSPSTEPIPVAPLPVPAPAATAAPAVPAPAAAPRAPGPAPAVSPPAKEVATAANPSLTATPREPSPAAAAAVAPEPAAEGRPAWMRPAAYGAGAAALLLGAYATWQGVSATHSYRDARDMLRPDGSFQPGLDPARYDRAIADGDASRTRAYVGAGTAVAFAAGAVVLWILSREPAQPLAFRF